MFFTAYSLSLPQLVNHNVLETKKGVRVNFLSLIPHSGLRIALPKDKQLSQPTPLRIIYEYADSQ